MSSKKERNKEDTWKADELGKSIKDALLDTPERKHRSSTKRKSKETHKKADAKDDFHTKDMHLIDDKAQRLLNQNDGAPASLHKSRSNKKDVRNQPQDTDKPDRPHQKERRRSRRKDSMETEFDDKKAGKPRNQKNQEKGQINSDRPGTQTDYEDHKQIQKQIKDIPRSFEKEQPSEQDVQILMKGKDMDLLSDSQNPEDNYDDDFEDFDDNDSEDVNHDIDYKNKKDEELSEVAALRRAMEKENNAILRQSWEVTSASSKSSVPSSRPAKTKSRQTFINFTTARQRQINSKLSKKTMQRGFELMNLIELDVSAFSLLEMTPVKVYELYIKAYGRSNTKQAFVQCHDDVLDREIQSEAIETTDVWTQYPSVGTSTVNEYPEDFAEHDDDNALLKVHSLRLAQFIENAGQVMNAIIEETASDYNKSDITMNQRSILFSQGYNRLQSDLPFLRGRHVTHAQFHPVQTNLLMTVYSMPNMLDETFSDQTIVCVWNVQDSYKPFRILTCKSEVKTCCFSPIKTAFAFAGTADGAILIWDLREPSSMHHRIQNDGIQLCVRVPTYSTNGVHKDEGHQCAVVTVQPLTTSDDSLKASARNADSAKYSEDMRGLSFQLASLDEQGVIQFWVVIELDQTDSAGSSTDLGLVPSGKVKLIKSSAIVLDKYNRKTSKAIQAKDMKLALNDPSHFYVATDSGILHGSRHGDRVSPKYHRRSIAAPVNVVQLDFSPFGLPYFLAASTDGCICLYSLAFELPLLTWSSSTGDLPVVSISWSRSRPSVFYVVDVTSKVYVWELLVCQGGPVKTEQFSHGRLTLIELSNDHAATGRGMQGSKPAMVITDDSGAVDVHVINKHFSVAGPNELENMASFLNTLS
ncbi:WD repeat-containing protein 60-like isoform X1 [Asterias rubens]|uniref:WD repeat-containing protein 60-like isoform X1 n=2 Tax=Asterias rubens TaxID=7604 RepID=UPI00145504D9|nr:WD repeat-containing protein 60-like isoform X1 [Asterias rubens]